MSHLGTNSFGIWREPLLTTHDQLRDQGGQERKLYPTGHHLGPGGSWSGLGEVSTQFPGVLVGALPVRKSPSNVTKIAHATRLGRPLGPYLAPPRGPPHGWAVRPCRASTSLAPVYSPCASSAFDWGSNPPSRSALAPVGSSPGYRTPISAGLLIETAVARAAE
jgi:hypothetical protein